MKNLSLWMSENTVIMVVIFFTVVVGGLGLIIGSQMKAAGLSLKPLVFFMVFFGIIAVPQLGVHTLDWWLAKHAPADSPDPSRGVTANRRPGDFEEVYKKMTGGSVPAGFERDAKGIFTGVFDSADKARLVFTETGESRLIARFPDAEKARDALQQYGAFLQLEKIHGHDDVGWTTRRNGNDYIHMASAGNLFMAWSALSLESAELARSQILPLPGNFARLQGGDSTAVRTKSPSSGLRQNWRLMAPLAVLMLCAAVAWFFKGSTWSATVAPRTGVVASSMGDLRDKLLRLNGSDKPMKVSLVGDDKIEIEWDIADVRWIDHANAHGVKEIHRLSLRLDETSRIARVTEYWNRWEMSAGRMGLRGSWHAARGMKFFEKRAEKVIGVAVSGNAKDAGAIGFDLNLDLQALKAPVMEAVTGSGWTWRPMMWDGAPKWLHWLTE